MSVVFIDQFRVWDDVTALAQAEGFEVKFKELPEGEAGSTLERRSKRYILVNEQDPSMRQRFTILHEIAHNVLGLPSVHGQAGEPYDSALTTSIKRPPEEVACDAFASGCLVPLAVIKPLIEGQPFDVQAIADPARHFGASQHCIASQFIKTSGDHVAFVVAERFSFSRRRRSTRPSDKPISFLTFEALESTATQCDSTLMRLPQTQHFHVLGFGLQR